MVVTINSQTKWADIALWGAVHALTQAAELLDGVGAQGILELRVMADELAVAAMDSRQEWTEIARNKSQQTEGQLRLV